MVEVAEKVGFELRAGFGFGDGFHPVTIEAGSANMQVAASAEDCDEKQGSVMDPITYVYVYPASYAVQTNERYRCSILIFPNCQIPKKANITSALMQFFRRWPLDPAHDMNVDLYGNLVADAKNATDEPDITGRARTTATVEWAEDGIGLNWINSPSIVDIIQEIVDQGTWESGNAIAILFIAKYGTGIPWKQFQAYAWDTDPDWAAKLLVQWGAS